MRKKVAAVIVCVILLFSLSGCSLNFFSVESLMSPPLQSGNNGEIQAAFKKYMNDKNVLLKTPVKGDYQTSYVLYDLNSDGTDEALVFYVDNSVDASVRFALLEYVNDTWVISTTLTGAGSGVYDVEFVDMNGDGSVEIFIGWSLFETKTTRVVTVYSVKDGDSGVLQVEQLANEYYNSKAFVDFNSDGRSDLVLVFLDDSTGIQKSFMRNFSLNDSGELIKYNELQIDANIVSVAKIQYDIPVKGKMTRLFIDCLKSDNTVFTDVIYWDVAKHTGKRAFEDAGTATLRNSKAISRDIDGDGLIEVPVSVEFAGTEKNLSVNIGENSYSFTLLNWLNLEGDNSEGELKTVLNPIDSYLYRYAAGSEYTVKYDKFREALAFCVWNSGEQTVEDELFAIYARLAEDEPPESSDGTVYDDGQNVFYYSLTPFGEENGISADSIASSFISLK